MEVGLEDSNNNKFHGKKRKHKKKKREELELTQDMNVPLVIDSISHTGSESETHKPKKRKHKKHKNEIEFEVPEDNNPIDESILNEDCDPPRKKKKKRKQESQDQCNPEEIHLMPTPEEVDMQNDEFASPVLDGSPDNATEEIDQISQHPKESKRKKKKKKSEECSENLPQEGDQYFNESVSKKEKKQKKKKKSVCDDTGVDIASMDNTNHENSYSTNTMPITDTLIKNVSHGKDDLCSEKTEYVFNNLNHDVPHKKKKHKRKKDSGDSKHELPETHENMSDTAKNSDDNLEMKQTEIHNFLAKEHTKAKKSNKSLKKRLGGNNISEAIQIDTHDNYAVEEGVSPSEERSLKEKKKKNKNKNKDKVSACKNGSETVDYVKNIKDPAFVSDEMLIDSDQISDSDSKPVCFVTSVNKKSSKHKKKKRKKDVGKHKSSDHDKERHKKKKKKHKKSKSAESRSNHKEKSSKKTGHGTQIEEMENLANPHATQSVSNRIFSSGMTTVDNPDDWDMVEEVVDFEIPRLHSFESVKALNADQKEQLKAEGVKIRTGSWTKDEKLQLVRNWLDFSKQFKVSDVYLLLGINSANKSSSKVKRFIAAKHFYVRLAKGIDRPLFCVYKKARVMLHPDKSKSKLSEEQVDELKEMHAICGNKWTEISAEMGINPVQCHSAFRNHKEGRNLGSWSKEEDKLLRKAVKEFVPNLDSPSTLENVAWEKVAKKVATRNVFQCREHWFNSKAFHKERKKYVKWGDRDYACLIYLLYTNMVSDEALINWKSLYPAFRHCLPSYKPFTKKWYTLKKKVESYKLKSYEQIISDLYNNYLPQILGFLGSTLDDVKKWLRERHIHVNDT